MGLSGGAVLIEVCFSGRWSLGRAWVPLDSPGERHPERLKGRQQEGRAGLRGLSSASRKIPPTTALHL